MSSGGQAAEFYQTAQGAMAARLLRERLAELWPDATGLSMLGLGYAAPFLRVWRQQAARTVAAFPEQTGAVAWPKSASASCRVEEHALPFADLSFDRVLLVHGLEVAQTVRPLLREVWRVLRDDGRLLVVAPNRAGLWALSERTPFGHGQPYSQGQIGGLLAASLFRVERCDGALYGPPSQWRVLLRTARVWERAGHRLLPTLSGVTCTEAVKDVYAGVPVGAPSRRRLVFVDAG